MEGEGQPQEAPLTEGSGGDADICPIDLESEGNVAADYHEKKEQERGASVGEVSDEGEKLQERDALDDVFGELDVRGRWDGDTAKHRNHEVTDSDESTTKKTTRVQFAPAILDDEEEEKYEESTQTSRDEKEDSPPPLRKSAEAQKRFGEELSAVVLQRQLKERRQKKKKMTRMLDDVFGSVSSDGSSSSPSPSLILSALSSARNTSTKENEEEEQRVFEEGADTEESVEVLPAEVIPFDGAVIDEFTITLSPVFWCLDIVMISSCLCIFYMDYHECGRYG